jgi:protein TIF31
MTEELVKVEPSASSSPEEQQEEQPEAEADAGGQVLKDLVILPPLQKSGSTTRDELLDAVPLPPIRAEEPVSSIRAALSEVCGFAHLTNYRFVLEEQAEAHKNKPKAASEKTPEPPTISPYTGRNAVVSVPVAVKSLERETQDVDDKEESLVLDDYGDLTSLLGAGDAGLQDGSAFRVVLERYDVALIRDHVARLRSLLDGNSPSATSLDEGAEAREKAAASSSEEAEQPSEEEPKPESTSSVASSNAIVASKNGASAKETPSEKSNEEEKAKEKTEPKAPPKDMPFYTVDKKVSADCANLKNFFYLACGEDPALYLDDANNNSKKENGSKSKKKGKKGKDKSPNKDDDDDKEKEEPPIEQVMRETIPQLNELEEKTRVKCTIRFSGFHPPPQNRRLMGDLAYLEVTPPGETETIHLTAIPTGFYVNRSTSAGGNYNFDPSPAAKPCFSHELLDCLLQRSETFLAAWKEAIAASKARAIFMAKLNEDGPFASLFRVAIRGDFAGYQRPSTASASEGIDALIQNPSWLVPIPTVGSEAEDSWTRNAVHAYNPTRTEDDLADSFGVDIRSGTLRDWNEELQSAREMAVTDLQERIERARYVSTVG